MEGLTLDLSTSSDHVVRVSAVGKSSRASIILTRGRQPAACLGATYITRHHNHNNNLILQSSTPLTLTSISCVRSLRLGTTTLLALRISTSDSVQSSCAYNARDQLWDSYHVLLVGSLPKKTRHGCRRRHEAQRHVKDTTTARKCTMMPTDLLTHDNQCFQCVAVFPLGRHVPLWILTKFQTPGIKTSDLQSYKAGYCLNANATLHVYTHTYAHRRTRKEIKSFSGTVTICGEHLTSTPYCPGICGAGIFA